MSKKSVVNTKQFHKDLKRVQEKIPVVTKTALASVFSNKQRMSASFDETEAIPYTLEEVGQLVISKKVSESERASLESQLIFEARKIAIETTREIDKGLKEVFK